MSEKRYFDIGFCKYSKYFLYVLSTVAQALYSRQFFKNWIIFKQNYRKLTKFAQSHGECWRSLLVSLLAVNELYHVQKNIGMLLPNIATSTSVVGWFLHFLFFPSKVSLTFMGEQEWARSFSWVHHAPNAPAWLRGWSHVNTFLVKIAQFLLVLHVSTLYIV